jgi:hypothetical protein
MDLQKWIRGMDETTLSQDKMAGACECDNEPSCSIKCGKFLEELRTCQLSRKDSAPWRGGWRVKRQILLWMLIVNFYGTLYVSYVGEPVVIVPSHDVWDYRTSFYLIPVLSWHIKVLLTDHKRRHLTNHTTC